jgi:hypothetical protein
MLLVGIHKTYTFNVRAVMAFTQYIDKTYGEGTADELITMSRQIKKFTDQDLKDLIEQYS